MRADRNSQVAIHANCTGRSAPAASVSGNRKGAILVTLPRLVYVEEDRFQTLFSDPRAVLDVAGALKVG